jgi:hypothetical protein
MTMKAPEYLGGHARLVALLEKRAEMLAPEGPRSPKTATQRCSVGAIRQRLRASSIRCSANLPIGNEQAGSA